jgi:putative spermidine/putrescine transport system permease protein
MSARAPEGRMLGRTVAAGIVIAVLMPLLPLVLHSVAGRWLYPDLLPAEWSFRAWQYIARPRARVLEATLTSLSIALAVTLVCILAGVPAGRALAALPRTMRSALTFLFFLPIIVPALAVALGLHVAFLRIGMSDTLHAVVVAHLLPTLPYMVLVMASTFARAPAELEHQARTLGAGPVRAFLTVGLRSAVPGLVTGALFVFLI